jgi:hypothetical protein
MSIPASQIVTVNPGVVSAQGNPLALNGLFLTENLQMPTFSVYAFASALAVSKFFGPASAEYMQALIYFGGFDTSTVKPGFMLFAPYNVTARSGFLQSGSLASISLTTLKTYTGVLTITLDGVAETSSTINLSGATSFSNACTIIEAAFTTPPVVTYNPVNSTFVFTSPTTGASSSVSFASGSLAAELLLTQATGAFISAGAVLDTPNSAMNNAVAQSQNWGTMVTLFEPVLADKENFATWFNAQNNRYGYLAWDTDAQASVANATEPFGVVAKNLSYNGVACISGSASDIAAGIANGTIPAGTTLATAALATATFVAGAIASINFSQTNGRITLAFRSQSGLAPTCNALQTSENLLTNGYSYYGAYATANQGFVFFYNGNMPGEFEWLDSFVNQIYLNAQLQLALMTLVTQVNDLPYNQQGYGLIRAAMGDPIVAALNFGGIRAGITLSAAEIAEVNQASGVNAASTIETQGYYLQILDPGAQARSARQTPIINFFYTDGGAIQQITLASIDIQ